MTTAEAASPDPRELRRWMVLPALSAGLFTVLALDPPTGAPPAALWVQGVANAAPGRLLLRVEWRDVGSHQRAPGGPRGVALRDRSGVLLDEAALFDDREPLVSLGGPSGLEGTLQVTLQAGSVALPVRLPAAPSPGVAPAEELVQIDGRALMPELPTRVRVRAPGARSVRLVADPDTLQVTPSEAAPDVCGVAGFTVVPSGFDAPVAVEVDGRTVHRARLRVAPGALGLALEPGRAVVSSGLAPERVFVATGAEAGPSWWGAVPWPRESVTLAVPLPPGTGWVSVARSVDLDQATTRWLGPPEDPGLCASTLEARRWWAALRPVPQALRLNTLYDGPGRAARRARGAARRVRIVCSLGLVLSVGLELALVLSAVKGRLPEALRPVEVSGFERALRVAAVVALLLLAALALSSSFVLRATLER
ncbi:MAG: hypothetical protein HY909_12765 [Deltaproteobacteria bacterium]|nr:hypothetical protein [Deltaproteobacteria bacterium]